MFKRILLAIQFHTIFPVRVNGDVTHEDMAGSVTYFPVAGAVQGFMLAASALAFSHFFESYIAAALALAVYTIFSGGFDLDGLADTADALSVKSSGDTEADRLKRLEIMKDSHVGAMGVMALILTILLKFVLINGLIAAAGNFHENHYFVFAPLFLMPVFSKWATIPVMFHGKPARKEGLGQIFIGNTGARDIFLSSFMVAALYFSAFRISGVVPLISGIFLLLFLLVFFYAAGILITGFLTKRFGGLTGDHLGAITEAAEIAFLIVFLLWVRSFGLNI